MAVLIIGLFIAPLAVGDVPGWGNQSVVGAVVILGTAALPVCMGVAVLKYRLYEINRIISRVVSYTLITALLGGVYAGLILLASWALPSKNSVAVAVATLVTAALFNPLRKRVQRAVDRRFNRRTTMPRQSWPRSPRDCAGPSIWTRYEATLSASSTRRSSPPTCRCGSPAPDRTLQSQLLPLPAPISLTGQSRTRGPGPCSAAGAQESSPGSDPGMAR